MNSVSLGPLWHNGPTPGQLYDFPGQINPSDYDVLATHNHGYKHSGHSITTGSSVVGMIFQGGVVIAADTLVSYGSLARFDRVQRVHKVNDKVIWGCNGDYADYQNIRNEVNQLVMNEISQDDNTTIEPEALYNWLTNYLYRRRSKFQPLYVDIVVGGLQKGEPFLGNITARGKAFQERCIANGFGAHIALPILRDNSGNTTPAVLPSHAEALANIAKCMKVLFYRDCRAYPKYTFITCEKVGNETQVKEDSKDVEENWEFASLINQY